MDTLNVEGVDSKLYYIGSRSCLNNKCIAVVGTRRVTSYGSEVVADLVPRLVAGGMTIVSGLAAGVDEMAHWETISVGGFTIGLLGCGFKYIKNTSDGELVQAIVKKSGLLMTPFSYSKRYTKKSFIYRNYVIASICDCVVVIEANERSGAVITAEFAMDMDKPVFAVPGPIFSKYSKGCHFLIKNGAVLVESHNTVLDCVI